MPRACAILDRIVLHRIVKAPTANEQEAPCPGAPPGDGSRSGIPTWLPRSVPLMEAAPPSARTGCWEALAQGPLQLRIAGVVGDTEVRGELHPAEQDLGNLPL